MFFCFCFFIIGTLVQWDIVKFNKITRMKLLRCQGISQHVATIIFYMLKVSALLNLKDKGREGGMFIQVLKIVTVYVQENLLFTSTFN